VRVLAPSNGCYWVPVTVSGFPRSFARRLPPPVGSRPWPRCGGRQRMSPPSVAAVSLPRPLDEMRIATIGPLRKA
jgi:hypothetical protein